MKGIKRTIAFSLALLAVLSLVFVGSAAEIGEDIPTVFINNEAWYKYQLLPLIVRNDAPCVAFSVFASFDFLSVEYDENINCCLISSDDGKFISVNTEKGRYLTSSGERGNITVFAHDREYYLSADIAASALGLKTELAFFYDKDVIRIYSEQNLQSLSILIDHYIASPDITYGGSSSPGGYANRKDVVSIFADITDLKTAEIKEIMELCESANITMTYAVDADFVKNKKNFSLLADIASEGHTFAISADPSDRVDVLDQIEECNKYLMRLFKKKSLIVYGISSRFDIKEKGYTILSRPTNISEISILKNINFDRVGIIYLDQTDTVNLSKIFFIASEAIRAGKQLSAINQLTGK
ncbi:MAG: hypothetical protein U0M06_09030 [Clostridia bacterium]|nr:hypothetical protein [Clostridia bacterium]